MEAPNENERAPEPARERRAEYRGPAWARTLACLGYAEDLDASASSATRQLLSEGHLPPGWSRVLSDLVACGSTRALRALLPHLNGRVEVLALEHTANAPRGEAWLEALELVLRWLRTQAAFYFLKLTSFSLDKVEAEVLVQGICSQTIDCLWLHECDFGSRNQMAFSHLLTFRPQCELNVVSTQTATFEALARAYRSVTIVRPHAGPTRLALKIMSPDEACASLFVEAIRRDGNLKSLCINLLDDDNADDDMAPQPMWRLLCAALVRHRRLKRLTLRNDCFDIGDTQILADTLPRIPRLQRLRIIGSFDRDADLTALGLGLRSLRKLELDVALPGEKLLTLLEHAERCPQLTSLSVTTRRLSASCASFIAQWLRRTKQLQTLKLKLGKGRPPACILEAIEVNHSLEQLHLSAPQAPACSLEYLVRNRKICVLSLEGCKLGGGHARHLSMLVQDHPSIRELNLGHCQLGTASIATIAQALQRSRTIHSLVLEGNPGLQEALNLLIDSLRDNRSLFHLAVCPDSGRSCQIDPSGWVEALRRNVHLSRLDHQSFLWNEPDFAGALDRLIVRNLKASDVELQRRLERGLRAFAWLIIGFGDIGRPLWDALTCVCVGWRGASWRVFRSVEALRGALAVRQVMFGVLAGRHRASLEDPRERPKLTRARTA